jgi:hypothetical protein
MMKLMGLVATYLISAFLFGCPSMAKSELLDSHAATDQAAQTNKPVPPTHVVIDPPLPGVIHPQPRASDGQAQPQEEPLPRFQRPEWVIVYVTVVYTLFAGATWVAIKRQADTMDAQARKAIGDTAANAATTQETLTAIRRQADSLDKQAGHMAEQLEEMRKAREIENKTLILQYRPRIIIRNTVTKNFNVTIGENIKSTVAFQLVNTGGSPAHITHGEIYLLAVSAPNSNDIRFAQGTHGVVEERSLHPGERENFEDVLDSSIVADEGWTAFHQGRTSIHSLYLLGTIWYKDDLGIPRQAGVHRKYDPSNQRFVPQQGSEDEYSD